MKSINVVIPCAGRGSRFANVGYNVPKPLIPIFGTPMIFRVMENLRIPGRYIFLVLQEHIDKFNIDEIIYNGLKNYDFVEDPLVMSVSQVTRGAAETILLTRPYINNDHPLLTYNSDQITLDLFPDSLYEHMFFGFDLDKPPRDGTIVTFKSSNAGMSYVKIDGFGFVKDVAEKQVISDYATTGLYIWRRGLDYVRCADKMIAKNATVNGEFYAAMVYKEALSEGAIIDTYHVNHHVPIGTPEELDTFFQKHGSLYE